MDSSGSRSRPRAMTSTASRRRQPRTPGCRCGCGCRPARRRRRRRPARPPCPGRRRRRRSRTWSRSGRSARTRGCGPPRRVARSSTGGRRLVGGVEPVEPVQLVEAVDHDAADAHLAGPGQLGLALVVAVEDEPPGSTPAARATCSSPAGGDVEVEALLVDQAGHGQAQEGLRRRRRRRGRRCPAPAARAEVVLVVDEQGAELGGQVAGGAAGDGEPAVVADLAALGSRCQGSGRSSSASHGLRGGHAEQVEADRGRCGRLHQPQAGLGQRGGTSSPRIGSRGRSRGSGRPARPRRSPCGAPAPGRPARPPRAACRGSGSSSSLGVSPVRSTGDSRLGPHPARRPSCRWSGCGRGRTGRSRRRFPRLGPDLVQVDGGRLVEGATRTGGA